MNSVVKILLMIGLAILLVATIFTVVRITANPRARPIGTTKVQPAPNPDGPVKLGSIKMIERRGTPFDFEQLKGEVWIASMFFSTCAVECKNLNQTIAALQQDPAFAGVRFVSVSVDPIVDTPRVLAEYARGFEADQQRWFFLSGELDQAARLGAQLNVTVGPKQHTRRLTLIDRQGNVRGGFHFNDQSHMQQLRELVAELLRESGGGEPEETSNP